MGLECLRVGNFSRAEAHFQHAYQLEPGRAEVCYALGQERLRAGDAIEAERLLRQAWSGDPSLISAAAALARCLGLHLGRYADAYTVLQRATSLHDHHPCLSVVEAELLIEEARMDEARAAAERALDRCQDGSGEQVAARAALARVLNQEGIDLVERGEASAALFAFKRAGDLDPLWSSPHVNIGATFMRMGRLAPALQNLERAAEIEPWNATAHLNLGIVHGEANDHQRAREHLERAICLSPECADAWAHLGAAFLAQTLFDDAEACLRRALRLDPDNTAACTHLADLLTQQARYLEAAVFAERLQLDDRFPAALARQEARLERS